MSKRYDQTLRDFAAVFLRSEVEKDGQIKGFSAWYDDASPWQREQFYALAGGCFVRIESGADAEESIADGVRDLRDRFRSYVEPARNTIPAEEVRDLLDNLARSFGWIGSSPDAPAVVPKDGGCYLRHSGIKLGLWPPAFLNQSQLQRIGWPWPEWPKTLTALQGLAPKDHGQRIADPKAKTYNEGWDGWAKLGYRTEGTP